MNISARRSNTADTRLAINIRHHIIPSDAPVESGGKDEGPSPHDLYDAALTSCKALTVQIYARRRSIPVEDVEVLLERDGSQERQGVYRLKASLRITGNLSDAQRAELLSVADKCPVHRLMSEVKTEVETVLI